MKQQIRASLSIPVKLKSLLKQNAARKNLFLGEYIATLLLHDLESPDQAIHEVSQPFLEQAGLHERELDLVESLTKETSG
jgi:hypothetical protein